MTDSNELDGTGPRPLVVTDDVDLLDDLLRLAAAAQVEPDVATSVPVARGRWGRAPLVVVGADMAHELRDGYVPMRANVIFAIRGDLEDIHWRDAVALGADQVIELPEAESWLVDRFAAINQSQEHRAPIISFLSGRGGAGATTLAAALAVTAVRHGQQTFLVDLDPLGAGVDVVLGADSYEGLGWADLAQTRGRIPGVALTNGLPEAAGVRFLTWATERCEALSPGAAGSAIDSLASNGDVVIVDLPRALGESAAEAICRSEFVAIVVPNDIRSCAAAERLLSSPLLDGADLRLVVRGPRNGGLSAADVSERLGVMLATTVGRDSGVDKDVEAGLPPGSARRRPLARAGEDLLSQLMVHSKWNRGAA